MADKTEARAAWRAARALGRLDSDPNAVAVFWAELGQTRAAGEAAARAVRRSKVTLLAERALREAPLPTPAARAAAELVAAEAEVRRRRREAGRALTSDVVARATAAGGHLIKGLAARRFYADPELRHSGDIDLHFDDFGPALRVFRELRDAGWRWDDGELPWLKWDDGRRYGQWALLHDLEDLEPLRIDAHVGPYSVGHLGLLPLDGFETAELDGIEIAAPDPTTTVALTAAHAAGDFFLSMKDVNDVAAIAATRPVDWERAAALAREAGVEAVLVQLRSWAHEVYDTPAAAPRRLDRPLPPVRPRTARRALFTAQLAFAQERARGTSRARALARAAGGFAAYTRDLSPRRGAPPPPATPVPSRRRRWFCWRLLPEPLWRRLDDPAATPGAVTAREELGDDLAFVFGDGACVLVWDREVFVPTVWGPVTRRALALARAVAAGAARARPER